MHRDELGQVGQMGERRNAKKIKRRKKLLASKKKPLRARKMAVGWREWVALPALGIQAIKAKFDTGARTSALHAFEVETYAIDGEEWVRFTIQPLQRSSAARRHCLAKVVDRRWVTNPGGRREKRLIIATNVRLGDEEWPIEINLTDRDEMGFRFLIGRTAMHGRLVIDPVGSYRLGKPMAPRRKGKHQVKPVRRRKAAGQTQQSSA